jgi:hypothetical protein
MRNLRVFAFLGLLALSACVSTSPPIQPDSLAAFRDTLVQLNVKSTEALTAEYDWNYRNYKQRVKADSETSPKALTKALTLDFCETDFDSYWGSCEVGSEESPVFMVIADSKRDLSRLNQMMIDYANFLLLFNNANDDTRSSLENSAAKIGQSAQSIAAKAGKSLNQENFGAFATIGVGIVEQLLAKKQKDGMAAVLADFQPGVETFAELGSEAMRISAVGIQTEYQDESPPLRAKIATESDGAARLQQVEKLIALNEQTSRQLDTLKILSAAYESLPGAHAELISALQSGYRASLGELVSHIEMISSAYQTLHAPGTD